MTATWIVERTRSPRFPYRVAIEQGGRLVAAFRAQARWPGPGQQIFCLRERELDPAEPLEPVERVPVAHLGRVGRKLTIVLDRPNRKRCEFLTIQKSRKDGAGPYEQVFFRTESGIRAHRSRSRVELATGDAPLHVVVDSAERYPWRFPGATLERRKLPAGDYALLDGQRIAALVERKSFDNLLGDIGAVQALHQQLADLASHEGAALVIEADYRDFLDPARLAGRWPAAHLARVLGEIAALHPRLPVVYAGNRKLANAWTERFFTATAARGAAPAPQLALDIADRYAGGPRTPGLDTLIRETALEAYAGSFTLRDLSSRLADVPADRVRRVVDQLRKEGRIVRTGRGRGARWERAEPTEP
ncbi:MAG: ERCC4 domain-containing protein [Gemmatimonadales bacterium]